MLIRGGSSDNSLRGSDGDDIMIDPTGNDWINGGHGNDHIGAGEGNDRVFGDEGNDSLFGEGGNDYLYGDSGHDRPRGAGQDNDKLYGGPGDDVLFASDGRDQLTGGDGHDTFVFQSHNPVPDPTSSSEPGYANILDFDPTQDTFAFDAVGYYSDGVSASFVNHASSRSGHPVDTFYSGAAADAHGEDVVVVTDKSFYSGDGAANAIANETAGDIIVYHDGLTKSAILAYVTSENHADEFARLGTVHSVSDLAALGLSAWDFAFV
ncbi:calcium-binding protein [Mesorhizobium abyssinicae]|uniref:calcium-binding protein n=1 Tax=Mesorhizobium abyssinicae TaxID=1209958 RepID=UPI0033959F2C